MIHRQRPQRIVHTAAAPQTAQMYDHAEGDRVMTCDGHPGVVTAVLDGPFPGTEAYMVTLDGGMGGGTYTPGQITPAPGRIAGTAAADYPELARVLAEHPDPAAGHPPVTRTASLVEDERGMFDPEDTSAEQAFKHHFEHCPDCTGTRGNPALCPEGERLDRAWTDHAARADAYYNGTDIQPVCRACGRQPATVGNDGMCSACGDQTRARARKAEVDRAALAGGHQMAWQRSMLDHYTGTCQRCGHRAYVTPRSTEGMPSYACPVGAEHEHARHTIDELFGGPEYDVHRRFMDTSDQGPHHLSGLTEVLAAAEMSLGETISPSYAPGPGPTKPHSPSDNPGSSGWASSDDPVQWMGQPLYALDSRVGAAEADLHEQPEPALPSTDGELNADDADPEALTPSSFTAFLASFQASAAHLAPGGGAGDQDIAAAAQAHLASLSVTAAHDFSPGERRALIEEGAGVRAGNSDRLDLTGTHYAELQALLDGAEGEDDPAWLS